MRSVKQIVQFLAILVVISGCESRQSDATRAEQAQIEQKTDESKVPAWRPAEEPKQMMAKMAGESEENQVAIVPQSRHEDVSADYRIVEQKREYGELRVSVATSADLYDLSTEQTRAITEKVVDQYQHEDRVAVFFYNSGRKPDRSVLGADLALCRFDWSRTEGLTLRFDQSERREQKPEDLSGASIPKYEVLETLRQLNGRESGSVLVASFSRQTPPAERERVARLIMAAEGFDDLYMYATREALEADNSTIYSRQHPEAEKGRLGGIINAISVWK
ncbi:MAG: hypothetical protein ABFD90_18855 [Phycisphaerales bacterium]